MDIRVVRGQRDHHIQMQAFLTAVSRQQATTAVILRVVQVVPGVIQPEITGDIVPFHCVQVSVYISVYNVCHIQIAETTEITHDDV